MGGKSVVLVWDAGLSKLGFLEAMECTKTSDAIESFTSNAKNRAVFPQT